MVLKKGDGSVVNTIDLANGSYAFTGIPSGQYCIFASKAGFQHSVTMNDNVFNKDTDSYCTTVPPSNTNAHLAMVSNTTFSIEVYLWNDKTNDGVLNKKSSTYNIMIKLLRGKNFVMEHSRTSGYYKFEDVDSGDYCLYGTSPDGLFAPGVTMNDNVFDSNGTYCLSLPQPGSTNRNIIANSGWVKLTAP
ncbi:hypothetical protein SAMD00019534_099640 [Acytostelium subglobosum LB1]|uniref:hypothetical protein n=1 Tax=Acytostelium subglobosum LB1 TaxID=1410327 RepID=UPI0006449528|nr:hypothetical protein SAMD00019534_099640 [Acytostelium subglobosum LB1]GAM26789.1 hypothetical protein SAMD00019534_099640 [Acytostelium subglobosum LB1]|eukprot:XP_012750450.1 hypothetical protein SAMD00019534_099640 [Acytostelium subglobosum LB1]